MTCEECFFARNGLCALELDEACPTFRPDHPEGLRPPTQLRFVFRQERRRLFPKAAAAENALELNEGLAEYTGARLGLRLPEQRLAYATYALARQLDAPSFVRSFAYASGPAYGLLLDEALPDWRRGLGGVEATRLTR